MICILVSFVFFRLLRLCHILIPASGSNQLRTLLIHYVYIQFDVEERKRL
jgi:hypothetical protein